MLFRSEAYTLVLHRLGRAVATTWLMDLLGGTALINPTPEDYRDAMTRVMTLADQPITIFDAVVAVLATRMDMEVWTYDHHFDIMRASVWR